MRTSIDRARSLSIDIEYLRDLVERISSIGSSRHGFRVAGTPEDRQTAELVCGELEQIGLADVAVEHAPVDAWRFEDAAVEAIGGAAYEASSWGGTPGTPADGVRAPLVYVGTAERAQLDRSDLVGKIALVDWRGRVARMSDIGLELGLRGAVGIVASCPVGAAVLQSDGALGTFPAAAHPEAPPAVLVTREAAAALKDGVREVRMTLRAELSADAEGCNAVGYLAGQADTSPLVVGAHHDAWFRGAFDNATGVAAMLAIARAFRAGGHVPRRPICFTSRTAEEYGGNGPFDGLAGAWQQVSVTHREWGESVPFHLCVEASGHPDLRLIVTVPLELRRWAAACCRAGASEGWLTTGWRLGPPIYGTEEWPFGVAGIPSASVYSWDKSFERSDYHSPYDTPDIVDFDHLVRLTRLYALMLLEADRDPDAILDHPARARELARTAAKHGMATKAMNAAAERHARRRGRAAFTPIGPTTFAVTARGTGYPYTQSETDVRHLDAALEALARGNRRSAIRHLSGVGDNQLARYLSEPALALRRARLHAQADTPTSWARHLTASPDLWAELASLRGERGARPTGPWIEASLRRHLEQARAELERRLERAAHALAAAADADS